MLHTQDGPGPDRRPCRPAPIAAALAVAAVAVAACAAASMPASAATPEPTSHDVKSYCANVAVAASDARLAWQTNRLNELEGRLKARIAELDAKTAELRDWINKRDQLEHRANDKLVGIYSKMKPETAATQIASLDDDMAAAVLGQLSVRQASAIFNEIVPERAAKLAGMIAGAPPPTPPAASPAPTATPPAAQPEQKP